MSKQMIYVRQIGGAKRRPIEAFRSLVFKVDGVSVLLKDNTRGFISRNMAKKILKVRPELLNKQSANALIKWLKKGHEKPDERTWLEILNGVRKG